MRGWIRGELSFLREIQARLISELAVIFPPIWSIILGRLTSLRQPLRPDEISHPCHWLTEGYIRGPGEAIRS